MTTKHYLITAVLTLLSATGSSALAQNTLGWDKTFRKSTQVEHQKVSFYNRLGINLVGDLYVPGSLDPSRRYPALVVGHPYGGVKEQTSGLYAQTMAERGFVTLAFDASYNGESGGQPHFIASPEALVEDFSAAVDYLGTNAIVDRGRIGVIGICGGGGFSLAAAQIDPRIKAVATVSMYDIGQANRQGLAESLDVAALKKSLGEIAAQRWAEADGAEKAMNHHKADWPADELRQIAGTDDFHISPFRDDDVTYGTPTWIWSVVVDDALYVRGYNGQQSRWYHAAIRQEAVVFTRPT